MKSSTKINRIALITDRPYLFWLILSVFSCQVFAQSEHAHPNEVAMGTYCGEVVAIDIEPPSHFLGLGTESGSKRVVILVDSDIDYAHRKRALMPVNEQTYNALLGLEVGDQVCATGSLLPNEPNEFTILTFKLQKG